MRVIDTNIIIRFLAQDDPEKSQACRALFERAGRGEENIMVPEVIVAEAIYVLTSPRLYAMPRDGVAQRLRAIVNLSGVHVPNKSRCLAALSLYETHRGLDYPDAVTAAYAAFEDEPEVYSYDRDFGGLAVGRFEP